MEIWYICLLLRDVSTNRVLVSTFLVLVFQHLMLCLSTKILILVVVLCFFIFFFNLKS